MARTYGTQIQSTDAAGDPGSTVAVTVATTPLVAARANRALLILNNQDAANPVFLRFGATPATAVGVRLAAGQILTLTAWTGQIHAIAVGGTVNVGVADL